MTHSIGIRKHTPPLAVGGRGAIKTRMVNATARMANAQRNNRRSR